MRFPTIYALAALLLSAQTALRAEEPSPLDALERSLARIEADLLGPWERAWKSGDPAAAAGLFEYPVSAPALGPARKKRRELDGVSEFDWSAKASARGRGKWASMVTGYLAGFEKLESLELQAVDFDDSGAQPSLEVRYDARGLTKSGERRNDRGVWKLTLARVEGSWKVKALAPERLETLTAAKPVFSDETASSGLSAVTRHPRLEAIRRGGYALAVGDYDSDGKPDLYVGGYGKGQLFHNAGQGRFEEVPLGDDTLVKSALFADMDSDGKVDLTLQRFVPGAGGIL